MKNIFQVFQLVGPEMIEFRNKLKKEKGPKDLKQLLTTITPPKGIRRKNLEGVELFDCDGDEIEEKNENDG